MSVDRHQLDEDGEHDSDECELCIEQSESTNSECRCGKCCQALLIEASLRDAEREPRIRECGGIYDDDLGRGPKELIGFMLNDKKNDNACRFFDRDSCLCTIYETRPLACRVFDCGDYEHAEPDKRDSNEKASQ